MYHDINDPTFLRVTEPGDFPLYRSQSGEFEMEFTFYEGWALYAVLPRYGRLLMGKNLYRAVLAAEHGMQLEARE